MNINTKLDYYDYYFQFFEYSYPYKIEPIIYYHRLRELSQEFLSLFIKDLESREVYNKRLLFIKLKRDIQDRLSHVSTTLEDLKKWFVKYNIDYDSIISISNPVSEVKSELMRLLCKEPSSFKEIHSKEYNRDEKEIQTDFYNYWYGYFLRKTLKEIEEIDDKLGLQQDRNHITKPKTFPEYLIFEKKTKLADLIKIEYTGKKGKDIALLISDLTIRDPKILNLGPRENAQFYGAMKNYLGESIGSASSINKYLDNTTNSYVNTKHSQEIQNTKTLIDKMILSLQ